MSVQASIEAPSSVTNIPKPGLRSLANSKNNKKLDSIVLLGGQNELSRQQSVNLSYAAKRKNQTYDNSNPKTARSRVVKTQRESVDCHVTLFTTKCMTKELLKKRIEAKQEMERSETEVASQLRIHQKNALPLAEGRKDHPTQHPLTVDPSLLSSQCGNYMQ